MWLEPNYNSYKEFATRFNQQHTFIAKDSSSNDNVNDDNDSFIEGEHHTITTAEENGDELYEVHNAMIRREKEILLYNEKLGHLLLKLIQHAAKIRKLPK
jgi:hypothetical protein